MTTKKEIQRWINTGRKKGAAYIISVCDCFDYEDYPVYVMPNENLEEIKAEYRKDMQRINEIIKL